ncbi:hypothetical protein Pan216_03960 [Planctomycetes bacterium Pan216]|uniref:Uncharacterized protein n=1 Tax=Kolteria novifilia TaxID=2527975 RepID=A0A518AXW1_9BACT|nr:hypothetical protein Pan216_03960 [Planctomycetes bacterium Pan216]
MSKTRKGKRPSDKGFKTVGDAAKAANAGDREALEELRQFLDENPSIWQQAENVAQMAESSLIRLVARNDALSAEVVKRQVDELKTDLLGGCTSVVERMLVDTVVATWLELHYLRIVNTSNPKRSVTQGNQMLKWIESAQRRHFTALKELTQIRKLLPNPSASPDLRIFTGERKTA